METLKDPAAPQLTRREAMGRVALTGLGVASVLSGAGELAKLAAQGPAPVNPTPPPATDPNFPMPPSWKKNSSRLRRTFMRTCKAAVRASATRASRTP